MWKSIFKFVTDVFTAAGRSATALDHLGQLAESEAEFLKLKAQARNRADLTALRKDLEAQSTATTE